MTKLSKLILILCLAGTAYYSFKIFTLKDTLNQLQRSAQMGSTTLSSGSASTTGTKQANKDGVTTPTMLLQFSLSTTDVDLMERCKATFKQAHDQVTMRVHGNVAQLQIERRFPQSALNETLSLHQILEKQGCLQTKESFRYQVLPN
jgi:hypothetical protein